jgi:ankyrin repeat protein
MCAVEQDKIELVKLFLSRGVDLYEKDNKGDTVKDYIPIVHRIKYINIFKRWEITMGIVVMEDLIVYYQLDASSICDLYQLLESPEELEREKPDYSFMRYGYGPSCGSMDR